jgi:NAD(P)-dependent dehydrogenase (short-subunit alcohol dehydrogenase family)
MIDMHNELHIVTGGSSGLGLEIARGLLERPGTVCIIGRDHERLLRAVDILGGPSPRLLALPADVSAEDDVAQLFVQFEAANLQVAALYNVAGIGRFGDPGTATAATISSVFAANLIGTILMCTYALGAMRRRQPGGTIVNVMSSAALVGRPQEALYCAAKWGARGYTESLRLATKGTPIRVVAIYPGGMATPFWSKECGLSPDTTKFMNPVDVARRIIESATANSSVVSDISISRAE